MVQPDQFGFIMCRAVRPLIQLQLPTHLSSPANIHFEKERLTPEESFKELGINHMLPRPFHPKLSEIKNKHATCCLATAMHMIIRKAVFDTEVAQPTVAGQFQVQPKKLHVAVSSRKHSFTFVETSKVMRSWVILVTPVITKFSIYSFNNCTLS